MGSVEVNEMIKVGGIQNTQVLWQAVFLAALPPKLYFARAIPPATQANEIQAVKVYVEKIEMEKNK